MSFKPVTEEDMIKEVFALFDNDNDGFITTKDMRYLWKKVGQNLTDKELRHALRQLETTDLGFIDFQELVGIMTKNPKTADETCQEMREIFNVFDRNGSGFITARELMDIMHALGEKITEDEAKQMITVVDADEDGRINFEEFCEIAEG